MASFVPMQCHFLNLIVQDICVASCQESSRLKHGQICDQIVHQFQPPRKHLGGYMNSRVGWLLLAVFVLLLTPIIVAATPQQADSTYTGLPWAYGFPTSPPPGE